MPLKPSKQFHEHLNVCKPTVSQISKRVSLEFIKHIELGHFQLYLSEKSFRGSFSEMVVWQVKELTFQSIRF